jgi:hypothetical protein
MILMTLLRYEREFKTDEIALTTGLSSALTSAAT